MASVTIKRGTEAEVASTAITDGQILFTTDREYNNQIMADVGEERILIGGNNVFTGTQAEYEEALSQGLIFEGMQVNITDDYDRDLESQNISYDNTDSGLTATNVKDAIDEVQSEVDFLTEVDGTTGFIKTEQVTITTDATDGVASLQKTVNDVTVLSVYLSESTDIPLLFRSGNDWYVKIIAQSGSTYSPITSATYTANIVYVVNS